MTISTQSFHHHFEIRVLSVSHWMGMEVRVVIYISYVLIWINQVSCFSNWNICTNPELSMAVVKSPLDTGCFICVLTTDTHTCGKPNCLTYQGDWHVITPLLLTGSDQEARGHVLYSSCWFGSLPGPVNGNRVWVYTWNQITFMCPLLGR